MHTYTHRILNLSLDRALRDNCNKNKIPKIYHLRLAICHTAEYLTNPKNHNITLVKCNTKMQLIYNFAMMKKSLSRSEMMCAHTLKSIQHLFLFTHTGVYYIYRKFKKKMYGYAIHIHTLITLISLL